MLNNVVLQGRLTAQPELKTTTSGVSVCSFTLAVERNFKNGDERLTDFIHCVAWRSTAEFVSKHFVKGQMMVLVGELQTRKYDATDGSTRVITEIVVDNAFFAGDAPKSPTVTPGVNAVPAAATAASTDVPLNEQIDMDGLPY